MSNPAVRAGVIYGLIVAVVGAITTAISIAVTMSLGDLSSETDPQVLLQRAGGTLALIGGVGIVAFIVNIVLYLMAGRSAASKTGKVSSGPMVSCRSAPARRGTRCR